MLPPASDNAVAVEVRDLRRCIAELAQDGVGVLAEIGRRAVFHLRQAGAGKRIDQMRNVALDGMGDHVDQAARGDVRKALGILKRAGVGNPPMKGDKLSTK